LRITEKEYIASLPRIDPQPEQFKGRFDIPVIVDPRLHWSVQCILTAVFIMPNMEYKQGKIRNWGKWKTPEMPYISWMHDGQRNIDKSAEEVRRRLAFDERGTTLLEGLGLIIASPNILYKDREWPDQIVLPGTSVFYTHEMGFRDYEKRVDVPRISCHGEKSLDHIPTEPGWSYGSVTCGVT